MALHSLGACDGENSAFFPAGCAQVFSRYMNEDERQNYMEQPSDTHGLFRAKELLAHENSGSTAQKVAEEFAVKVKKALSQKKVIEVETVQRNRLKEHLHCLHGRMAHDLTKPAQKELIQLISAIRAKMFDGETAPAQKQEPKALFAESVADFMNTCKTEFRQTAQTICADIQKKLSAEITDQEKSEQTGAATTSPGFLEVELDQKELRNLAELHEIPDGYFTGASLEEASAMIDSLLHYAPDIRRISFQGMATLSPEIVKKLSGFTNLCELSFAGTNIGDRELAELQYISKLTRCNLSAGLSDKTRITDAGLACLPATLEELSLTGRRGVTPQGFITLFTRLQQLKKCDVSYTNVTYAGLMLLPVTLEELNIRNNKLTENEARSLFSRLQGLRVLVLCGHSIPSSALRYLPSTIEDFSCHGGVDKFTPQQLAADINRLSGLKKCYLNLLPTSDQVLAALPDDLEVLRGWNEHPLLTAAGITSFLMRAQKLRFFGLSSPSRKIKVSAFPCTLEKLDDFQFKGRTEEELIDLFTRLKKLKIASLEYPQITERVIASFPPSLKILDLGWRTCSEEELALLRSRIPHLEIIHRGKSLVR